MLEYIGRLIAAIILISLYGVLLKTGFAWIGHPIVVDYTPQFWFATLLGGGIVSIMGRIGV